MDINQELVTVMLHFDGANASTTITDNSHLALGGTCIGTAALSTTQKKFGTASLKTGSANGNYLKLPAGRALDFGSGDFTVEGWVWPVSQGTDYGAIMGRWDDATPANRDWLIWRDSIGAVNVSLNGAQVITGAAGDLPTGAFAHVALTRAGTALQVWVGGVAKGSVTFSGAINCTLGQVSALGQSNFTSGSTFLEAYYDEVRVTRGLARYTSAFTAPATYFDSYDNPVGTVFLLHANTTDAGGALADTSNTFPTKAVTPNGTAALSTAQKKFGDGALKTDGTATSYATVPDSTDFDLSSGDFTVECWVYPLAYATSGNTVALVSKDSVSGTANGQYRIYINSSGNFGFGIGSGNGATQFQGFAGVSALPLNAWSHVALVLSGTTLMVFVNGTLENSAAKSATIIKGANALYLGIDKGYTATNAFNGYLDEVRITKGFARYTANFLPPLTPFYGPTVPVYGLLRGSRISAAQGLVYPTVGRKSPMTPYGSLRIKDATWGGSASVSGKVTINNVAAVRRVFLVDLKSMAVMRTQFSDINGNYSFANIDGSRSYMVIGRDYQQVYNAVVQDLITAVDAAPAAFRPARRKLRFKAGGTGLSTNYPALIRVGESTPIGVSGINASNLSQVQAITNADVICPVRYMPRARDDVADIVFTDTSGNQLDFWMEGVYGTAPDRVAYYWVKLPGDLDAGPVDIYVQYNRGLTQTKTSNGAALPWTLFDDFNAYDGSKWTAFGASTSTGVFANSLWSMQANGSESYVTSVATFAAGLEALAVYTQFGYNFTAGAVQNQFGFMNGTTALSTVATLENLGDYQAGSRLAINGEATANTNGRLTPSVGGGVATSGVLSSAQAGRIALARGSDGSVVAQINNQTVMTRSGAGTGNANLALYRGKNSQSGYVSSIDWVALRKYIPSGPPAMLQFAEEFL
ncbi:DUF2341 domain-containing protein [Cupriavidus sp. CuC1]|uniref:DUF2341 domain-containing protein n=1 Tax=Cupriavidus sp. CuC1 TaxID=3373131 RepID=UPI0037CFEF73